MTPRAGPFLAQGHNLNKLGRGLLDAIYTKYQGIRPCGFKQDDFYKPIDVKHMTPGTEPFLARGASFEQTW